MGVNGVVNGEMLLTRVILHTPLHFVSRCTKYSAIIMLNYNMTRYFLITISIFCLLRSQAQELSDYVGTEWTFSFLMIPGNTKSITTNYHATYFEFTSDSSFVMGMSEAVESGRLNQDSTLSIKLYDYNSDIENKAWAESFKVYFCSNDYLILQRSGVSYNGLIKNYKGFGDIWYVYSKQNIGWDKEARRMYKKIKKEHNIN